MDRIKEGWKKNDKENICANNKAASLWKLFKSLPCTKVNQGDRFTFTHTYTHMSLCNSATSSSYRHFRQLINRLLICPFMHWTHPSSAIHSNTFPPHYFQPFTTVMISGSGSPMWEQIGTSPATRLTHYLTGSTKEKKKTCYLQPLGLQSDTTGSGNLRCHIALESLMKLK